MLPRIQLFEFCDMPWFRGLPREMFQEYLGLVHRITGAYERIRPAFEEWLGHIDVSQILDLCSGSGEHFRNMKLEATPGRPKIWLSDLYPQIDAMRALSERFGKDRLDFIEEPVSAVHPKQEYSSGRARTIFTALHHFRAHEAAAIINDALDTGHGIFIAELFERRWAPLLQMSLGILGLVLLPFCGRFSLKRLCLTPFVTFAGIFDGVVSVLRTYDFEEIVAMVPEEKRKKYIFKKTTSGYLPGIRAVSIAIYRC